MLTVAANFAAPILLILLRLSSDRLGATRHGHHRDRARNTRAGHVLLGSSLPFPKVLDIDDLRGQTAPAS